MSPGCTGGEQECTAQRSEHVADPCAVPPPKVVVTIPTPLFPPAAAVWVWFSANFSVSFPFPLDSQGFHILELGSLYTMVLPATVPSAGTPSEGPTCLIALMMCSCGRSRAFNISQT